MSLVDSYLAEQRAKEAGSWVNLGISYDTARFMMIPIKDQIKILEKDIYIYESKARNLKIELNNLLLENRMNEKENKYGTNDGSTLRAGAGSAMPSPYSAVARARP